MEKGGNGTKKDRISPFKLSLPYLSGKAKCEDYSRVETKELLMKAELTVVDDRKDWTGS